jgi:hypothetical protein
MKAGAMWPALARWCWYWRLELVLLPTLPQVFFAPDESEQLAQVDTGVNGGPSRGINAGVTPASL